MAGYTAGLNFEDILVPSWAAGFSAYGCACAEYEYRADKTVQVSIANAQADLTVFAAAINRAWEELKERVSSEFAKSGVRKEEIEFRHHLRVQYVGQLNDVEIQVPFDRVVTSEHVQTIIDLFEEDYSKMYSRSARSPELGYLVTTAIITGVVDSEKPNLPEEPLGPEEPDVRFQQTRQVYYKGSWTEAKVYEMERLKPGNRIRGFAVLESPNTTFVVPTGYETYLELPFQKVHEMQSSHKDPDRFWKMLQIAQESVPWDDKILLPYAEHLYVVEKPDKSRVVKCDCGHEFGDVKQNWKLQAVIYVRDSKEKINEIYPDMLGCDPDWMELREYICPGCATLLEVEAVPPGYPVVFDFQPDIDTFYEKWLNHPLK